MLSLSYVEKYDKIIESFNSEQSKSYMKKLIIPNLKTNDDFVDFIIKEQKYLLSLIETKNDNIQVTKRKELFELLEIYGLSCLVYLSELAPEKKSTHKVMMTNRDLFIKKNSDYGNSFEDFGYIGIIIRINDKINRLKSLYRIKNINIEDESFEDTINDLYNYTILGLLYK